MPSDRDRDREKRYRSRSRSRDRDRERDRRDRRERRRSVSRSRSRSPRRRGRSPILSGPSGNHEEPTLDELTPEERKMREVMGFANFHTTKGKKVENNTGGAVHVIMKRKYRQYMNRKGGFNRPLDFVA